MSKYKQIIIFLILDIIFISLSTIIAFWLRFPNFLHSPDFLDYQKIAIFILLIRLGIFYIYGLYRQMWRYTSINEFISIFYAVTISSMAVSAFVFFVRIPTYPRAVLILDWLLCLVFISGIRFMPRVIVELKKGSLPSALPLYPFWQKKNKKRLIIIGAGDAGEGVVKELKKHPELGYEIVGFIDDDLKKQRLRIHGISVLGSRKDIVRIVKKEGIDEIIIAIPSADGKTIRDIISHCEKTKVRFKIVPGVFEIISGDVSISHIREIRPEDLLGRETVQINLEEVAYCLNKRKILITGAAGSIGAELCHQIIKFDITKLILLDHNENGIYFIDLELKNKKPSFPILPIVADIKDAHRMEEVFKEYMPEVVFHAAAHKHVPLMEANPQEAIKNNIFGSKIIMEMASKYNCERFVLISTDKAVNPINVMGYSKRIAELLMQSFNNKNKTKFMAVRFGNVLGSEGSVIPLFKHQIANGGPVTVTHPEVTRYFMTINEAVELIIQSAALGNGGEIFVLDMGQPIKIVDLAKELITLSGFEPEVDIKIEYIGLRPGEKLFEELLTKQEGITSTKHKQIFIAKSDVINQQWLNTQIDDLEKLVAGEGNKTKLVSKLKEVIVSAHG